MSTQVETPDAKIEDKPEKAKQKKIDHSDWGGSALSSGLYHQGSVLANRLGLQLAKVATLQRNWRSRKLPVDPDLAPYVEAFERDGVLLMENFLPDDVFAAVQAECKRAHELGLYKAKNLDDGLVEEDVPINRYKQDHLKTTWDALGKNDFLKRLAAAMMRRPEAGNIKMEARVFTEEKNLELPDRLSGSNYLHADVHYPTVKAWLYLNDIDDTNGALVYGKGTHKLTRARLMYEYEASIRVAKARRDGSYRTTVASGVARLPSEKQLKAMGYVDSVMAGKANSLVWANVQGMHKRGAFEDGAVREQIQIRFFDRPNDHPRKKKK